MLFDKPGNVNTDEIWLIVKPAGQSAVLDMINRQITCKPSDF